MKKQEVVRDLRPKSASFNNFGPLKKQHQDKTKTGQFSIEEDREILTYVLRHHPDIIEGEEEENINMTFWDDIGAKLNRKPQYVYKHWTRVIQPVLTRHIAG